MHEDAAREGARIQRRGQLDDELVPHDGVKDVRESTLSPALNDRLVVQ